MRSLLISILFSLLFCGLGMADTIYVPGDYSTIQAAINASSGGDTIIVSDGTYTENIDFLGKTVTVESADGPEGCIIDGGQNGAVVTIDGGEGRGAVLDGFTVENGTGKYWISSGYWRNYGGGIYIENSSPTIQNCWITNNECIDGFWCYNIGGGIYCGPGTTGDENLDSPKIVDCKIYDNFAYYVGSAMALYYCDDDTITSRLEIYDNDTHDYASAGTTTVCFAHCDMGEVDRWTVYHNNSTTTIHAAFGHWTIEEDVTVTNLMMYENYNKEGTGKCHAALSLWGYNTTRLYNCTFSENASQREVLINISSNNDILVHIYNAIVWPEASGMMESRDYYIYLSCVNCDGDVYFDHNCLEDEGNVEMAYQGTLHMGNNNVESNPLYVNAGNDDYHISSTSPCLEAGKNYPPGGLPLKDFEGDTRIIGPPPNPPFPPSLAYVDIGADEYVY